MLLNCGAGEDSWRVPWTARRSNQSILKDISPGCLFEGLMLKLKLQYFGHLMLRADSSEKTLMLGRLRAGGEGDNRKWDGWMASPTQWTWVCVDSGSWWWIGRPRVLQSMVSQRVGHDWATKLNCTEMSGVEYSKQRKRQDKGFRTGMYLIHWKVRVAGTSSEMGLAEDATVRLPEPLEARVKVWHIFFSWGQHKDTMKYFPQCLEYTFSKNWLQF